MGAGWSLTEMLVALALGATVLAGSLTAWMQASQALRAAERLQRLHERAQYAFATLGPEIQMAGFAGSGMGPQRVPEAAIPATVARCGPALVARLDLAVESAPQYSLRCPGPAGVVAGSHTLTLRRAASRTADPRTGRGQLLVQRWPPRPATLHWDAAAAHTAPPGAPPPERRDLVIRHYYVAPRSDGDPHTPALRVKTLTEIAGAPGFTDTEVMHGIESMQVTLQPSALHPVSVAVTLRLRDAADTPRAAPRDAGLSVTRIFTIRNAALRP